MELKGITYFDDGDASTRKYMLTIINELKKELSTNILGYVITGFFMVEYFGLPQFDVQPMHDDVQDMFRDLVKRGMATMIADTNESEDGLMNIDYNTNKAIDYIGERLVSLFGDSTAKNELVRLAKLCSRIVDIGTHGYIQ